MALLASWMTVTLWMCLILALKRLSTKVFISYCVERWHEMIFTQCPKMNPSKDQILGQIVLINVSESDLVLVTIGVQWVSVEGQTGCLIFIVTLIFYTKPHIRNELKTLNCTHEGSP